MLQFCEFALLILLSFFLIKKEYKDQLFKRFTQNKNMLIAGIVLFFLIIMMNKKTEGMKTLPNNPPEVPVVPAVPAGLDTPPDNPATTRFGVTSHFVDNYAPV